MLTAGREQLSTVMPRFHQRNLLRATNCAQHATCCGQQATCCAREPRTDISLESSIDQKYVRIWGFSFVLGYVLFLVFCCVISV